MITYLLLNGYPSDTFTIPLTIVLSLIAITMVIKGIKGDLKNEKSY